MRPLVFPLAERLGRIALHGQGVRSRLVPTHDGRVHAYDAPGKGHLPPTVLLHGLGSSATPFAPLLACLRPHVRRAVAPDYLGHGFSEESRVRMTPHTLSTAMTAALDELLDEPAIIVGNSLGGVVGLAYAVARPERVRALVLVAPAGALSTDEEWRYIRQTFAVDSPAAARALFTRLYHKPPWFTPLVAREVLGAFERRGVRDIVETATNEHACMPEALASLAMPVLLIWGESERILPARHFAYFSENLPKHAKVERHAGFGHCPHLDAPARLAERLVAFARGV